MLADQWWLWAAAGLVLAGAAAFNGAYRRSAAALRRRALARRFVDPGAGRQVDTAPAGFWGDLGWLLILTGVWIALSPWIWGYDTEPGAIATDVTAGIAIVVLSVGAILFPGLLALNVAIGTWLLVAPYLVGFGDLDGLSDTIAGVLVIVASLLTLSDAARRTRPAGPAAVARIRRNSGG